MLLLFILACFFLFSSGMIDPGIMIRGHVNDIKQTNNEYKSKPIRIKQLGFVREYKICQTCYLVRPLRSTHCNICDNCVVRFDHHCPWIGSCVGARNYPHFFIYLCCLNLLQIFTAIVSIVDIIIRLVENFKNNKNKYSQNEILQTSFCEIIISLYIFIYICITMTFTTGLLLFHIRIVFQNMTTKEELKKFFKNPFGNPFQRRKIENFRSVIFPKKAKMGLIDILNYNKKMYDEQKEFLKKKNQIRENDDGQSGGLKENTLKESEINISIDKNKEIKNIDSREHFEINNDIEEHSIKNDSYKLKQNIIEKSENEKSSSRETIIDRVDKNSKNQKANKSMSTISDYGYDVEESQSYIPGIISNMDINNNQEFHVLPLIKDISSKKTDSTKEKDKYIKRNSNFEEKEDDSDE